MKSIKKPSRSRTIEESLNDKALARLLAPHPRVRVPRPGAPDPGGKCIVYWMQRAQRGVDNPALNMAIALGNAVGQPVLAVFSLTADYPDAQRRHYRFLVEGLVDAENDLMARNVPLIVRLGRPGEIVPVLAAEAGASLVVGDENPVRIGRQWREQVAGRLEVPYHIVDADVVVPTSLFPKEEFAARTLRPKIHRVWEEYLKPLPSPHARVCLGRLAPGRRGGRCRRPDGETESRRGAGSVPGIVEERVRLRGGWPIRPRAAGPLCPRSQ